MLLALAGLALGLVARAWLLTLRIHVHTHPSLPSSSCPWVLALWHGHLLPLLAHRRRGPTVALVSQSSDGQLLAWAMRWFRVTSVRGSCSRGGKEGLRAITERLLAGSDVAFAVDGPRGPRGIARPGALAAAARAHAWVVPYAVACSRATVLGSWDHFQIPWPFSRVVVVLGEPTTDCRECGVDCLALRIDEATRLAQETLRRRARLPMSKQVSDAIVQRRLTL
jgi:lysophospholipid acyltransferase (LPLAT)-like uncharacterized protein